MSEPLSLPQVPKLPLMHGLNETELRQLTEVLVSRRFKAGEWIFEQGQSSQALWILLEGRCEVIKCYHYQPKESVVLAELEPNSYFGEMSFFSPAPHSASVRAKTDVNLLYLSRGEYDAMIREGVSAAYKLAYNVLQGMAQRLRHTDEWLTRLATHHDGAGAGDSTGATNAVGKAQQPEWLTFRDKLFKGWNL